MKKIISTLMSIIIALTAAVPITAHTTSQSDELERCDRYKDYNIIHYGCEEHCGWCIFEGKHAGGTSTTYKLDSSLSASDKQYFETAKRAWTSRTKAKMTETSNNPTGTVSRTYPPIDNLPNSWVALTTGSVDSKGHYKKWIIAIRPGVSIDAIVLMHEIGHVYGLGDLQLESNKDKIMYYKRQGMTATAPTSYDISGFNVITGLHTAHSWKYTNQKRVCTVCNGTKVEAHSYKWTDYSSTMHKGTCSKTGDVVYEPHVYYLDSSTGKCTRCGRTAPIAAPLDCGDTQND